MGCVPFKNNTTQAGEYKTESRPYQIASVQNTDSTDTTGYVEAKSYRDKILQKAKSDDRLIMKRNFATQYVQPASSHRPNAEKDETDFRNSYHQQMGKNGQIIKYRSFQASCKYTIKVQSGDLKMRMEQRKIKKQQEKKNQTILFKIKSGVQVFTKLKVQCEKCQKFTNVTYCQTKFAINDLNCKCKSEYVKIFVVKYEPEFLKFGSSQFEGVAFSVQNNSSEPIRIKRQSEITLYGSTDCPVFLNKQKRSLCQCNVCSKVANNSKQTLRA